MGLEERLLEEKEREEAPVEESGSRSRSARREEPEGCSYVPPKSWERHLGPGPYGYVTEEEIAQETAEYRRRYGSEVRLLASLVRNGVSGPASGYMLNHLKGKYPYHYDRFMAERWSREVANRGATRRS